MRSVVVRLGISFFVFACAGSPPVTGEGVEASGCSGCEKPRPTVSPEERKAWVEAGQKSLETGSYKEARDHFAKAVDAGDESGWTLLGLGESRLLLSEPGAVEALRKAVAALSENPRAHLLLAVAETAFGDPERAKAAQTKAVEMRADLLPTILEEADRLETVGAQRSAIGALRWASSGWPSDIRAKVRLGSLFEALGDTAAAAEAVEDAARTAAKSAHLFRRAAALWQAAGNATRAEELNKAADRLDPKEAPRKMRPLPESRRK